MLCWDVMCCTVPAALTQMKFSTLVSYMSYENWFNQILFWAQYTLFSSNNSSNSSIFFHFDIAHCVTTHWATYEQMTKCVGVYVNVICMTIRVCDVQKGFSDSHKYILFSTFLLCLKSFEYTHTGRERERRRHTQNFFTTQITSIYIHLYLYKYIYRIPNDS